MISFIGARKSCFFKTESCFGVPTDLTLGELLPVAVGDDEGSANVLDGPGRREAAGHNGLMKKFCHNERSRDA